MRVTYSYAKLRVSEATYDEIKAKLEAAGYADQFNFNLAASGLPLLNMHGIALEHEIEMTESPEPWGPAT